MLRSPEDLPAAALRGHHLPCWEVRWGGGFVQKVLVFGSFPCFLPRMEDFEFVKGRERKKVGGDQAVKVIISRRR